MIRRVSLMALLLGGPLVFDREQREPVGVLVVAAADAVREEQHRDGHEHEAHEHLQDHDLHSALLGERDRLVHATTVIELTGMITAQTSGDRRPAYARPTATTLYARATARFFRVTLSSARAVRRARPIGRRPG